MAFDVNVESSQQLFCYGTAGNTSCRFASGCTFENISKVTGTKLLSAGEVGVSGPGPFYKPRILRFGFELLRRHNILPMDEVIIPDHQRDRRTESLAMTNAGQNLDRVLFDLHASAASIALLPTPELVVDLVNVDG